LGYFPNHHEIKIDYYFLNIVSIQSLFMKKPVVKNPVAKNMAKLHKNAGVHGKSEKAQRRTETVKLQTHLSQELIKPKKNTP
jgi:hypothetical protein